MTAARDRSSAAAPIGIYDSGVGGLSVLKEIRTLLPQEDLLYVADSGHAPWGDRPVAQIRQWSLEISQFLIDRGAKAIVIACNVGTAAAAEAVRAAFAVPIVAMEPAVKPAAEATRNGVIGVLTTVGTSESDRFRSLLERFGSHATVVTQPAPGLVEQVEEGDLSGPQTRALVDRFTAPFREAAADTIVLGCTHYPFLKSAITEAVGRDVALIDSGPAVARQVRRVLETGGLLNPRSTSGTVRFWTSGDLAVAQRVITMLSGETARVEPLPRLGSARTATG